MKWIILLILIFFLVGCSSVSFNGSSSNAICEKGIEKYKGISRVFYRDLSARWDIFTTFEKARKISSIGDILSTINCRQGDSVGENSKYLYCLGSIEVPQELDGNGVIISEPTSFTMFMVIEPRLEIPIYPNADPRSYHASLKVTSSEVIYLGCSPP